MENHRRLIGVLEKELAQDIEDDGEDNERRESGSEHDGEASLRNLRIKWDENGPSEALCQTHCAVYVPRGTVQVVKVNAQDPRYLGCSKGRE